VSPGQEGGGGSGGGGDTGDVGGGGGGGGGSTRIRFIGQLILRQLFSSDIVQKGGGGLVK
jgi:hypothetical protein